MSKMEYCHHTWAGATQSSLSKLDSVSVALWGIYSYPYYSLFLTDEMLLTFRFLSLFFFYDRCSEVDLQSLDPLAQTVRHAKETESNHIPLLRRNVSSSSQLLHYRIDSRKVTFPTSIKLTPSDRKSIVI